MYIGDNLTNLVFPPPLLLIAMIRYIVCIKDLFLAWPWRAGGRGGGGAYQQQTVVGHRLKCCIVQARVLFVNQQGRNVPQVLPRFVVNTGSLLHIRPHNVVMEKKERRRISRLVNVFD